MSWKPAISRKRCARPARLATTDFSTARAVSSCLIHLRTARRNNVFAGSAEVTRQAIFARAIRLTRLSCSFIGAPGGRALPPESYERLAADMAAATDG